MFSRESPIYSGVTTWCNDDGVTNRLCQCSQLVPGQSLLEGQGTFEIRDRRKRREAYARRSLQAMAGFRDAVFGIG